MQLSLAKEFYIPDYDTELGTASIRITENV